MIDIYRVITLCGSTRFKDAFYEAQKRLTLAGNIVISVGLFGHSGDEEVWDGMCEGTLSKTKEMLDEMHKRKIDMADSIYVINVGGYIGDSTRSEIEYAKAHGKDVEYLEPMDDDFETRKVFSERNEETNIRYKIIYRKSCDWYEIWTDERSADSKRIRHQVKNVETEQIKHDKDRTIRYVKENLLYKY